MIRGPVTKPVDAATSNYTSDAIDLSNWDGCYFLVSNDGGFSGTVTVQALLTGINSSGTVVNSGSTYKQYGAALTVDRVEKLDDAPSLIKIHVVVTSGTVSVWAQPFSRG